MSRDYSNPMAGFGALISAMGGGGDTGNAFPQSDADDFANGAKFVPGEVTLARRTGKKVTFVNNCGPNCWYWEMPDGSRIYHFDSMTYAAIGRANNRQEVKVEFGIPEFEGGAGPCPRCGNEHTNGGTIPTNK